MAESPDITTAYSDTIFALSSGQPPAGIAIIRISGPKAHDLHRLFTGQRNPAVRHAHLVTLRRPDDGEVLDHALALYFAAPASATGEDVVEWHCHGGRAVVSSVLRALAGVGVGEGGGVREARPGEFTRRAFENGRMDLNEADGLADLLAAETEEQRRSALMMAEGHFSRRLENWRHDIVLASAKVEALLDFGDEDDVDDEHRARAERHALLAALIADIESVLRLPSAERLRDGIRVVIGGPPNAGKSTLLNALVGRDAAITSDIAGTTRDRIDVPVALDGVAYLFTDTAGLRADSDDIIENMGMDRSRSAIDQADIVLWLGLAESAPRDDAIVVAAQCDRMPHLPNKGALSLSALTGQGMHDLLREIHERAKQLIPRTGEYALHTRQRDGVNHVLTELKCALALDDLLLVGEHLRLARNALDILTGKAGVEDMLDALFGRFCIGK